MEYIIKPEKTAIKNGFSKSANYIVTTICKKDISILDYGAGKLRNSIYLHNNGFNVSVLDTKIQINSWENDIKQLFCVYSADNVDIIDNKFDIILCSYVLNVVSSIEERIVIIENIKNLLKENGLILIDVRGKNSLKDTKYKIPYKDGYIIGNNSIKTFQKEYSKEDLMFFLEDLNLEIISIVQNNTNLNVICKIKKLKEL